MNRQKIITTPPAAASADANGIMVSGPMYAKIKFVISNLYI